MLVALAVLSGGAVVLRREIATLVRDFLSPAPRLKTRILRLRTARADDVAAAIAGAPGEIAGGRRTLVVPHAGTNSLIIQAELKEFARIAAMVEELDAAPR
jgi:hypothetical protein